MADKDYYSLLHVQRNATVDEIRKSFHRLALLYHPDINNNNISDEQFKEINEAYQCLSDPQKRSKYDLGNKWFDFYSVLPEPYCQVELSVKEVKLNQEFEITYTYLGMGKFFRKPVSNFFVFTSGPVVKHENLIFNNNTVRQTSLTYTVSALKTGTVIFNPATIDIQDKLIVSNSVFVFVQSNDCYFTHNMEASEEPVIIKLHKEQLSSSSVYRKTYTYRHTVLIPRSNYAAYYHRIGSIMKGVFALCGLIIFGLNGQSVILGLVCGSLVAGLTCRLMYWMVGVKSRYFNSYRYPIVLNYLQQNYQIGNSSTNLLISNNSIHKLLMLFR